MEKINKLDEIFRHQICFRNNNILNDEKFTEGIALANLEVKIVQYYSLNRLNGRKSLRKLKEIISAMININNSEENLSTKIDRIECIIKNNKILNNFKVSFMKYKTNFSLFYNTKSDVYKFAVKFIAK